LNRAHFIAAAFAILAVAGGANAAPPGWKHYTDPRLGVTFAYPPDWSLAKDYWYGPKEQHPPHGFGIQIPASLREGTNLVTADFAVLTNGAKTCKPAAFGGAIDGSDVETLNADGRTYQAARIHDDAGYGEFYETRIFVVTGLSRCIAVKYFMRIASMTHYVPGEAKEYDPDVLWKIFDDIRATMVFRK